MPDNRPVPIVLSLLVCRRVIQDAMSREYSVIGITSEMALPAFPFAVPEFSVYTEVTGMHGMLELTFRIIEASEERPFAEVSSGEMPTKDPLGVAQITVGLAGLVFPEPGEYRLQLLSRGKLLMERKFKMVLLQGAP